MIKAEQLAYAVRSKRGNVGLRETSKAIGEVSAATLSRIECGKVPDLETYIRVCRWLQVPLSRFVADEFVVKAVAKETLLGTLTKELERIEGELAKVRKLAA